jgi:hypothetical protein
MRLRSRGGAPKDGAPVGSSVVVRCLSGTRPTGGTSSAGARSGRSYAGQLRGAAGGQQLASASVEAPWPRPMPAPDQPGGVPARLARAGNHRRFPAGRSGWDRQARGLRAGARPRRAPAPCPDPSAWRRGRGPSHRAGCDQPAALVGKLSPRSGSTWWPAHVIAKGLTCFGLPTSVTTDASAIGGTKLDVPHVKGPEEWQGA